MIGTYDSQCVDLVLGFHKRVDGKLLFYELSTLKTVQFLFWGFECDLKLRENFPGFFYRIKSSKSFKEYFSMCEISVSY